MIIFILFYMISLQRQHSHTNIQVTERNMAWISGIVWWTLPAVYLLAFTLSLIVRPRAWMIANTAVVVALAGTITIVVFSALPTNLTRDATDAIGLMMVTLIALLGWVIVRFSRHYLEGEPGQARYVSAMLFTLAAVSTVVLTHNLGLLVVAWFASSVGVHHLLTFYHDRVPAQIVAHKKFLVSRMAELCLLVALVLIYRGTGTLTLDGIAAHVSSAVSLSPALHVAAMLIALAAILKSAQLPLHGWLIQVMEAPTPVSALLHAGIVNIGGFVLIRLAELISAAPGAQALLVIFGSLTAVLAGLVMMTRISVKVRLAWSTCAQMGFMLMECGLGLYDLALLHLVAHSLYKAHAFLTAGETVLNVRQYDLAPHPNERSPGESFALRLIALPVALALVAGALSLWQYWLPTLAISSTAIVIIGIGLAPLLWISAGDTTVTLLRAIVRVLLLTQIYFLWYLAFSQVVPAGSTASISLMVWVSVCFTLLYLLQIWLLAYPRGVLSTHLYPWAYAGFYLDERFTRLTFRVWPARMTAAHSKFPPNVHIISPGER
jgi:NAD(P)H-quinone oxidoreductase subunit 5